MRASHVLPVLLVASALVLGGCQPAQPRATTAEDDACSGLAILIHDLRTNTTFTNKFWNLVGGAAAKSGDPAIVSAGKKMMADSYASPSMVNSAQILKDMLAFTNACDALDWGSGGNPLKVLG